MIIGLVEAMTGVGCIVGPVVGSCLYGLLGMKHTFLVYGSFLMFLAIIIKLNFSQQKFTEQPFSEMEVSETHMLPFD